MWFVEYIINTEKVSMHADRQAGASLFLHMHDAGLNTPALAGLRKLASSFRVMSVLELTP